MPEISRFYGIIIYMYAQDHPPPHFHAVYAGESAQIDIRTAEVLEGRLPRRALRLVQVLERATPSRVAGEFRGLATGDSTLSQNRPAGLNWPVMHFIEEILDVRPYRLTLKFNTGEIRWVDLEATLRAKATSPQSAYQRLLDAAVFRQVRLDRAARTVCWDGLARQVTTDGTEQPAPLDFCPDVLYGLSVLAPASAASAAASSE